MTGQGILDMRTTSQGMLDMRTTSTGILDIRTTSQEILHIRATNKVILGTRMTSKGILDMRTSSASLVVISFSRPRDFRLACLLCNKSISEAVLTVATCGFEARDAHGVARLSCDVKKPCCETLWPNFGCDMPNLDPRSINYFSSLAKTTGSYLFIKTNYMHYKSLANDKLNRTPHLVPA
uniref:Uncharacterized protein n=1 Tax=Glossina brevipalpis TaxID=37001 RepID=A0A1A9WYH6_9MUSC